MFMAHVYVGLLPRPTPLLPTEHLIRFMCKWRKLMYPNALTDAIDENCFVLKYAFIANDMFYAIIPWSNSQAFT